MDFSSLMKVGGSMLSGALGAINGSGSTDKANNAEGKTEINININSNENNKNNEGQNLFGSIFEGM